ncbi:MAG: DUF4065 domain-containing protein [Spirochaetaceae bacterium]|jgi:uncharacterized phage-associated protein|nr:DUF4065 domain-containing protein [Spirochaetaceae bacterium]
MYKTNAIELSNYLLASLGESTPFKQQKLVYYVEAWHLVFFDTSIISDEFEAWVHGPAIKSLWTYYKSKDIELYNSMKYPPDSILRVKTAFEKKISADQLDLIKDVLEEYGDKSGYHLETLSHTQLPWIEARKGLDREAKGCNIISKEIMKTYFKQCLNAQ